jgi:transposase
MDLDLSKLPDDARFTKNDIASLIELIEQKYQEKIHYLEERIRLLQNEIFGRRSEKRYPEDHRQMPLFDNPAPDASMPESPDEPIVIAEHNRKKRGRKPLPDNLPRVEIIHDLPEEQKMCQCGCTLSRIGADTCEKLDYVPAKMRVLRHIRYKYACKGCEGIDSSEPTVKIAPAPVQLIAKSIATEGLLAHIIVSKFADALPLYRQEKIFERIGVQISRATMANWVVAAAERCKPLIDWLENEIRGGPLINIDESPLQVLKEPGRADTTKSYMWVFYGGAPAHPAVLVNGRLKVYHFRSPKVCHTPSISDIHLQPLSPPLR